MTPSPEPSCPPARPLVEGADLAAALRGAMARADAEQSDSALRVAWLDVPSGLGPRLAAYRLGDHTVLWAAPRQGDDGATGTPSSEVPGGIDPLLWFGGWGAAQVVRTRGAERVAEAKRSMERVYANWRRLGIASELLPRFWGGMSFAPRGELTGCWESFGDATFVLPRWNYVDAGSHARLGLVYAPPTEDAGAALRELEALWDLTTRPVVPTEEVARAELERRESTSEAEWAEQVAAIHQGIAQGLVHKVVAARRSTLRLSPAPDPTGVFHRLGELAPGCHRFCYRIGARSFLGATPERLVSRRGRHVETQAIAGSIAVGIPGAAERLLASSKDRSEHEYVVAAIRELLSPLCERLDVAPQPAIRQLRHVLHLQTPIAGRLAQDLHLLDLVERLHPTPAVGGVPTKRALEWIARLETTERGWYAAPVGWVDALGDGEMLVALRSALLLEDRVHLYAGAGIVAGSEASSEYAETEVKLAGMRSALGVGDRGQDHASA